MEAPSATRTQDQQPLHEALAGLQATASQFALTCIKDARVRVQYLRDMEATSLEFQQAVLTGKITAREAGEHVNALRNRLMEFMRVRTSPTVRAFVTKLKKEGRTLDYQTEKYAQQIFGRSFNALDEAQQTAVWFEIVVAGGRGDPTATALAQRLGRVGRRLFLVSLAVAAYEIYESESKSREVARQGALAGAGIAGGWAVGTGVVAAGVCAAMAPVCVGAAALAGGILFAFGADLAFDTVYPRPSRR